MNRFLQFSLILAVAGMATLGGCSDDESPAGPTTGSVAGKVTFQGTWPATGDIQVSIYSNLSPPYIPMGPPDAFTNPIVPGSEYNYTIAGLDPGTYTAIYVGWRDPTAPPGPGSNALLGMYWIHADSVGIGSMGAPVVPPTSVSITSSNLNRMGLDITANLELAP
jgi:hypothetical protein